MTSLTNLCEYALLLAAVIYTVPIFGAIIAAHALAPIQQICQLLGR